MDTPAEVKLAAERREEIKEMIANHKAQQEQAAKNAAYAAELTKRNR